MRTKKGYLISFLNAILDFNDERKIVDVTLTNPYQLPDIPELKSTILDVKAVNERGEEFIVEMQNQYIRSIDKRSLYYSAKAYSSQLKEGDRYHHLKKVYFIGILGFNFFSSTDYIAKHKILNIQTKQQELDDMEFCFIELKKFNKTLARVREYNG